MQIHVICIALASASTLKDRFAVSTSRHKLQYMGIVHVLRTAREGGSGEGFRNVYAGIILLYPLMEMAHGGKEGCLEWPKIGLHNMRKLRSWYSYFIMKSCG